MAESVFKNATDQHLTWTEIINKDYAGRKILFLFLDTQKVHNNKTY